MSKPAFPLSLALVAALAAIGVAISGGCSSGDASSGGGGPNVGSDRGSLEGPLDLSDQIITESDDMQRLREEAFKSGGSNPNGFPMVEDTRASLLLLNHPKLHYSAIRHTGFLASLTSFSGSMSDPTAFGSRLTYGVRWNVCPFTATIPRWSLNNVEVFAVPPATPFTPLPLETNTQVPVWYGDPLLGPPTLRPGTPTNRYEDSTWSYPDFGNPDPPGYSIHEYYVREPWIPNAAGSRPLSAFLNRYGRIGFIRSNMDLWGYGSVSEAGAMERNVLGPGVGRFLSLTPTEPSTFRGTLIYRVDPARPPFRASYWPGAPDNSTGNAPITYGWSIDPESGLPVGVAIHAAGNVPLCACIFEVRFTPYNQDGSPFQPFFTGTVPTATSDFNFTRVPKNPGVQETDPALLYNGDPSLPIYPIHYNVYSSGCIPTVTPTQPPTPFTIIDGQFRDTAYQPNEIVIVPVLKPEWNGKLPQGTWRVQIVVIDPTCTSPTAPTEDGAHQLRYFHVWNGASPSFFRP